MEVSIKPIMNTKSENYFKPVIKIKLDNTIKIIKTENLLKLREALEKHNQKENITTEDVLKISSKNLTKNCECGRSPVIMIDHKNGKSYLCENEFMYLKYELKIIQDQLKQMIDYSSGFWIIKGSYKDIITSKKYDNNIFISIGGSYVNRKIDHIDKYSACVKLSKSNEFLKEIENHNKSKILEYRTRSHCCCICTNSKSSYKIGEKFICTKCIPKLRKNLKEYVKNNKQKIISSHLLK